MTRRLKLTVEVRQGHDLASAMRAGAGEFVEQSTYEITQTVLLPESMTLEDVNRVVTETMRKLRGGAA